MWRRVGGGEECDEIHGTGTYIQIYSRGEVCNHFNDGGLKEVRVSGGRGMCSA